MDCFHSLAVMHKAAMSIHVQVLVWTCVLISPGLIPRSGTAESGGNSMFNVLRKWQHHFTHSPAMYEASDFSASSPSLVTI